MELGPLEVSINLKAFRLYSTELLRAFVNSIATFRKEFATLLQGSRGFKLGHANLHG